MNKLTCHTLATKHLKVDILNLGASIYQIHLKNDTAFIPVVSTPINFESFIHNTQSYGRTVGRTAGRLFYNEKTKYYAQFNGEPFLMHGGYNRIADQYFDLIEKTETKIVLSLKVAHLTDGYVGNLNVLITYEIRNDKELYLNHYVTTDQDTLVRLTAHPYFNFEQADHLKNHQLSINSTHLLTRDESGIFTHEESVDLHHKNYQKMRVIDVNDSFNLDDVFIVKNPEDVCRLSYRNISMSIETNYPTLVVYTQNSKVKTTLSNAKIGQKFTGIAIETQTSQNELPLLKKDTVYDYYTIYKFDV